VVAPLEPVALEAKEVSNLLSKFPMAIKATLNLDSQLSNLGMDSQASNLGMDSQGSLDSRSHLPIQDTPHRDTIHTRPLLASSHQGSNLLDSSNLPIRMANSHHMVSSVSYSHFILQTTTSSTTPTRDEGIINYSH